MTRFAPPPSVEQLADLERREVGFLEVAATARVLFEFLIVTAPAVSMNCTDVR